jgi:hypothetical protein
MVVEDNFWFMGNPDEYGKFTDFHSARCAPNTISCRPTIENREAPRRGAFGPKLIVEFG